MPDKYVERYGPGLETETCPSVPRPLGSRPAKRKLPQAEEDKAQKKKGMLPTNTYIKLPHEKDNM